jgi:23S rRNA pseudouridine2605 synthase
MKERLQKILSQTGISSRRTAEKMISAARISVNGVVVRELGVKADVLLDEIRVDDRLISVERERIYIALNKPRGYLTTLKDPEGRPIVTDLLLGVNERVFPVGRLDYDSEGLLFLTNDGEFAQRLQHPRYRIAKTYRVKIQGHLTKEEMHMLEKGIFLPDGKFTPLQVSVEKINPKSAWLRLTLHDGRNRVIRRAFEAMGHFVSRLIRVSYGNVALDSLAEGDWRNLHPKEVEQLMVRPQARGNGKIVLTFIRK